MQMITNRISSENRPTKFCQYIIHALSSKQEHLEFLKQQLSVASYCLNGFESSHQAATAIILPCRNYMLASRLDSIVANF